MFSIAIVSYPGRIESVSGNKIGLFLVQVGYRTHFSAERRHVEDISETALQLYVKTRHFAFFDRNCVQYTLYTYCVLQFYIHSTVHTEYVVCQTI